MGTASLVTTQKETRLAKPQPEFSNDQIRLLGETVAKGCDQNELAFFLHVAKLKRLDPFTGQIHVVKRWDSTLGKEKMTVQVGIDGLRVTASRSNDLAGIDDPEYDVEEGEHPNWAKVTVYRYGRNDDRVPYRATARWSEYAQTKKDGAVNSMWRKLPWLMLGKCLPYCAKIQTDMGTLMIGDIVLNQLPVKVRSLNEETGRVEWRPVVNYFRNGGTQNWVKIWAVNGTHGNRCIRVTPEHQILTSRGWIEAKDIQDDDMIAVGSPTLNFEQDQIIVGSLLGDAGLEGRKRKATIRHFAETHCAAQADYLRWKANALRNLDPVLSVGVSKCQDGGVHPVLELRTSAHPCLHDYSKKFYCWDQEKAISREILDSVFPLALAVWIMDDGSIRCDGSTEVSQPYLRIATMGFTEDAHAVMRDWFGKRFGVIPSVEERKTTHKFSLRFSVADTAIILKAVNLYVDFDRENNSKRWIASPVECLGDSDGVVYVPVVKKEYYTGHEAEGKYDIEVENNHNFLYNNIVVHNCAEALALRKAFPDELSGMYSNEEMDQADNEGRVTPESVMGKPQVSMPKSTDEKKPPVQTGKAETVQQGQQTQQVAVQGKQDANGLTEISGEITNAKFGTGSAEGILFLVVNGKVVSVPKNLIDAEMVVGAKVLITATKRTVGKTDQYMTSTVEMLVAPVKEGEVIDAEYEDVKPAEEKGPDPVLEEARAAGLGGIFDDAPPKKTETAPAAEKPAAAPSSSGGEATKPGTAGVKRAQRLHTLISQNHKNTLFTEDLLKKYLATQRIEHARDLACPPKGSEAFNAYEYACSMAVGEVDWYEVLDD